jgi:hypothetical protein
MIMKLILFQDNNILRSKERDADHQLWLKFK